MNGLSVKVVYTHDWLNRYAGAEVVLSAMEEVISAPVYTMFHDKKCVKDMGLKENMVHSSFLQNMPGINKMYKNFLPLYPLAFESFDLSDYDVIISSSHSAAKGINKRKGQVHICYCHTPMRYIWDMYEDYINYLPMYKKVPFALTAKLLRKWDVENSRKVDFFMANSKFVAERIKRIYKRDAKVIYPPVDVERFNIETKKDDYYLFVGRLINAYKKVDIVVEAFNKLDKHLVVVGDGDDMDSLKSMAKSNIEFTGWLDLKSVSEIMSKAKALILPSMDDFGIVSVEAQACGTPVIAYSKGGAKETILDGVSGLFFNEQSSDSIQDVVYRFENAVNQFDAYSIRKNAEKFSKDIFRKEFRTFVSAVSGVDL